MDLRPFQRKFIAGATRAGIDTAALSIPRGNGKSWLAAHILTRCLTPGDKFHVPGAEYLLCAASIEQARLCYRFVRDELEPTGRYRFLDSNTRIGIVDKSTNTRLRVLSSNGKTSMGIVGTPLVVADEPGSWEVVGGQLMFDALATAQGKPGSKLRLIFIGTLAPAMDGWWHQLIERGSNRSTYVQALQGNPELWDKWNEIRRVNPLTAIDKGFRAKLLEERDAAREDTRLKARFMSYRLNHPAGDESTMLLTVPDWQRVTARGVPDREGKPIVGVDLGGGRAWSAAVAIWRNGRVEALAVAPGIPSIESQEKRDRVPRGAYERLVRIGCLRVAEGLRVQPVGTLLDSIRERWGTPDHYVLDRFRLAEAIDNARGVPCVPRITRWSESSEDIRELRKLALDGNLAVEKDSRPLLTASLAVAAVKTDDAGNARLVKRASNNVARDDVAAGLLLAAGALARAPAPSGGVYLGLV